MAKSSTITKPFGFVLMPFDRAFDDTYKLGIQAAASELGIIAERVDEQFYTESILERIYRQIDHADFVIADMTGKNPNVFYEVGYAHARGKLCTLLTQSAADIPFDLKHHRHLEYGNSIQILKSKLKPELEWLVAEFNRKKIKTIDVHLKYVGGLLKKETWYAESQAELVFDLYNTTDQKSPEIDAIYIHLQQGWKVLQNGEECASAESDVLENGFRHFVKPPISRLSSGAFAQVRLKLTKVVWWRHSGEELQESYHHNGIIKFETRTHEGNFIQNLNVEVECDEIPF